MLARLDGVGIDAHQAQEGAHRSLDALAQQLRLGVPVERRRGEGLQD